MPLTYDAVICIVCLFYEKWTCSIIHSWLNFDSNYDGWRWYLARTDNGKWELLMWGYA
ncbi:MAG: hypothetical protein NC213_00625 [Acetobacter sp.]|nr:hypothetical protein [Bacteroides sp.]MCM1340231.1 hypothetical protein [Acetobacter sp.]MCM1432817.1 hypothetical protein [Clostridiales bacterium]